ncbi:MULTISPECIES: DEAD/DEAH box helicase family protein [unclassified Desulfovibrio]|uniref:DEAD/DEAH box helicase family protein n=1 Tax=unclassified Desulfovibrio TaxID=2593640 RepID=UPI0013EC01DB|nr:MULTISPECIES: DEAD/DEAH box helicase family protein [unclassified Desulfovibrio]
MALHPEFPKSPHAILDPEIRWFPADESIRDKMENLMPPLVPNLRRAVKAFRDSGYVGASDTSRSLLNWWFKEPHMLPTFEGPLKEFKYYFAQREALETIIYLHDVVGTKDKFDLMRFDASGRVSSGMFDETWPRYVIKMATGSGKTKVMALALAWSYFHKLYEPDSDLSRNFLLITPNIIVLDRIYKDFQVLRIFFSDPVLPDNGYDGRSWRDDFQLTLHKQDEARVTRPVGNIFLTNIHRVYAGNESLPTAEDNDSRAYFLGPKPVTATTDSKVDLGMIVRDIDELMVINDEAHHIHDASLTWFKSIEDIHNQLLQKDKSLSLQLDVTATPKHNNGAIFVQTVADYPLVEAIAQNVVKHPVLPDKPSREKLTEKQSAKFTEKYADYLDLGVIEWRKSYAEHEKVGKKAILFVMTDDTRNCDEVAEYLEETYHDLKGGVLVIHTKDNGEISEASTGKKKEELERLRDLSNRIDDADNPYKAIVSVLMLKEGWDVRNVTTIVGLRAYSAKSNILPEQTLGRGLRKMYPGGLEEYVSVIGTEAFMDFVETIQAEGVELERKPMGDGAGGQTPLMVEVDNANVNKNMDELDIELPLLTPRIYREYKNLADLDVSKFGNQKVEYKQFTEEEQREIVFRDITTDEISHTTVLDTAGIADFRSVLGWFTKSIMKELRLFSGYDVLYGKIKEFVRDELFDRQVDLNDANTMRNLSELTATRTILESFKRAINALTVRDKGDAEIRDYIKLRKTRPFMVTQQESLIPKKSVSNRIVGDSHFELEFAAFLEDCKDVVAYAKNYLGVNFKLDYVNRDGSISHYYPDFIVKLHKNRIAIVETKGNADLDVPLKMERLRQWCKDVNMSQNKDIYDFVYVSQEKFEKYAPKDFESLFRNFSDYRI